MTTVATQTQWSWLKDLEEISRQKRDGDSQVDVEKNETSETQEKENRKTLKTDDAHDETVMVEKATGYDSESVKKSMEREKEGEATLKNLKTRDNWDEHTSSSEREKHEKSRLTPSDNEGAHVEDDRKVLVLPSIKPVAVENSRDIKQPISEGLVLPLIPSATGQQVDCDSGGMDNEFLAGSEDVSVTSLELLEQLTFPFFGDQTTKLRDGLDKESGNDSQNEEERPVSQTSRPVSAPLLKLDNLSWPSILQYMCESESLAMEYFSLENKEAVESQMAHNKRLLQQQAVPSKGNRTSHKELVSSSESSTDSTEKAEEDNGLSEERPICDFCGQPSSEVSLLQLAGNEESDLPLCCEEKKEFYLLMAVCMKQMVKRLQQQKPKRISVELTKNIAKKTAEEKALALMRRQRKWEELRRRKEAIQQENTKTAKNTQVIQFSLLSPGVTEGRWMVRPESSTIYQTPKQKQENLKMERALKKREEDRLRRGVLQPKTIERLKQCLQVPSELKVLMYGDGEKFAVLLPDNTGQIYYHSGNLAILTFSPYSGVLAYLAFEDSSQPCLLAYADELGRITCYNSNGTIRFLLRPSEAFLFDGEGCRSCKKHWSWSNEEETTELQPFTLSLNKQLSVKIVTNEKFTVLFSGSKQSHIKFDIDSKLNNDSLLSRDSESNQLAQNHLAMVKKRISHLLQVLKQNSRPNVARKHSLTVGGTIPDWQAIYSTKTLPHRGGKSRANRDFPTERQRTRSTGGLHLQKSPIKLKPIT